MHLRFTKVLVGLAALGVANSALAQINIPTNLVVRAPLTAATARGYLKGEYWKRPVFSIPGDGATNPTNRIDNLINGFGTPTGTFKATNLVYLGNDLSHITNWLAADGLSFTGATNNLDDGAFRFTGFLNVTNAGPLQLGTTSDDGSRIRIGNIDVVNNDGSHGDATVDTNVVFAAAGVYPIEVTYYNGDWTSDGTGDQLNHSGSTDPSLHGGANFHLRIGGADVSTNTVKMLYADAGVVLVPPTYAVGAPLAKPAGSLNGEYWKRPVFSIPGDGATNPTNRIDELILGFGTPDGTFKATQLVYLGNDLTGVTNWLGADAASFSGTTNNLDDGAFRFTGFINITNAGATVKLGTTSDDGSRITIGGIDIVNNDGSHGDATVDASVFFSAAGVYPIEVTYYNGDWTSDGTGTNLNHSGSTDPSLHGGANFHLRVGGADVTTNTVSLFSPTGPGILVPAYLAGAPPFSTPPAKTNGGSSLYGEYWRRPVFSIPGDGATNPTNRIDALLGTFGTPTGTFQAGTLVYLGNDLSSITNWLAADASSYKGAIDNLDDGAFRFSGWLNVPVPQTIKLGTTSDDGSRITIGGLDIVNNDGSHGDATVDANVVFPAAGLYPIEVTYYNGDWTSDGTGTNLNHSGSTDPSLHGGANFHLRVAGADVNTNNVQMFYGPRPAAPPVTGPALDGLLAYWNFDGTLYDSVNSFHGTARGKDPIEFVDGQSGFGKALKLDGTNYVEITGGPVNGLDSPNGSLSIAGWFKVDAFDKSWQALIAKGENQNYRVARRSDGVITNDTSIAYAGGVGEGAADTPPVNDGKWHHFVAVTDANVTEFGTALYIDGVRYSVNTNKPALTASSKNLLIGENPDALNRQWNGEIDDISIWNRVLTAKDVTALYNGGAGLPLSSVPGVNPPTVVTVLDFPFNEGKGTNTVDAVHDLVGLLGVGMGIDTNNVPVVTTRSPAGTAGDRAVTLNGTNKTSQAALVVNDRIGKALAFPTNAPFTIETWINIATNDTRTYEGIGAYGASYKLGLNNQQLQFTLYGVVDINSGIYPTNGWHHVAAVWEPGTGVEFFLDGTSVTNIAETRVPRAYQNSYLTIGAENIGANAMVNSFQGTIDRFRIHSGALDVADLDSVAATPKAALTNTVVAYNFNETNWPFASAGTAALPAVPNPAPKWTTDTPAGKTNDFALSFAPGTQVIVPDTNTVVQLDPADPSFTLQAWIKLNGNPATRQVLYYNNGPGGALSFSLFTNRTVFVTTLGIKDQTSNAKVPDDGHWHHIAVVHENAKEFRFYVDGLLADTQAYTGGVNFTRTNRVFYIGSEPTYGLQYTGLLDRLKLTRGILQPGQLDYPAGGTPPQVLEVAALEGAVGVLFNRPVGPSALNPANYTVDGTTVTSVTLVSPNYAILGVSAVPTNAFSVSVTGVATPVGDVMEDATLTAPATPGGTIPAGLMAHWSFDGHLADSVDGFDGAARGKVPVAFTNGPSAAFGKSLKLTGTNYVEIPGSSNRLQFANGSLSIAGWFRVDSFDKSWQALIAKGENSNYRVARRSDGAIAGDTSIAYAGGVGEGPADTPAVNDGKWHHFVAITDAAKTKFGSALYIDGVIHGVNTNAATLQAGTANLLIGENPEALNRQWVGEIDDIGLWNRVLAPEEIALLYNGGQGTPLGDLPGFSTPVPQTRPYTIGLNFAADEPNGANLGTLAPLDVAGALPQANWNNLTGQNGTNVNNIVADTDFETSTNTEVTVSWISNNTWASTGSRGETNNFLPGTDKALTIGYLDTGSATTTSVTISNIPPALTSNGYDVYVYTIGGVGGRGGAYRVLDAVTKQVLKDYVRVVGNTNSTTYIQAPTNPSSTNYAAGNYLVFQDVKAATIIVEATTENGYGFSGTPRAPINAIQLVEVTEIAPPGLQIQITADGLTITFEGALESADSVLGPWTDVPGTSPLVVTPDAAAKFYRAKR